MLKPTVNKQTEGWPYENSHYFKYGDYKLHYRIDEAKGKEQGKMFMIHGFGCDTTFYNELVEQYTKKGMRCVRVDLPDFGYSTRENKKIKYVPREKMLVALMDELDKKNHDKDKWIIVGHSMGGSVTLDLAEMGTKNYKALMLYAPMFMYNVPKPMSILFKTKLMCGIMNGALKLVMPYDFLVKAVLLIATMDPFYIFKYDASLAANPLRLEDAGTGLCYMSAHAHHPAYENMKDIDIPVLLVWGGLDLFVPKSKVKKLSESLPQKKTEIHTIKRAGHCLVQNCAKDCAKFGEDFMKKNKLY